MKKIIAPRAVREVMTVRPLTVTPELSLGELKALFEEHDHYVFPVVEGDRLIGIVSKLDLLRPFRSARLNWRPDFKAGMADRVIDVMTRGTVTVSPDAPISDAIDLMVDYRLHCLPVAERHDREIRLVGIVSRSDILRWLSVAPEEPVDAKG